MNALFIRMNVTGLNCCDCLLLQNTNCCVVVSMLYFAFAGSVKLVVRYTPKVLDEMEARFEQARNVPRRQ